MSEQNLSSALKCLRGTAELTLHLHFSFVSVLAGFNQVSLLQHSCACKAGEKLILSEKMCIGLALIFNLSLIPETAGSLMIVTPPKNIQCFL